MATQVILLERVDNLGDLGDVVNVKPGYARNYLIPQSKALRATKSNIAYFEAKKSDLEQQNAARRGDAQKESKKVENLKVVIVRHASEGGQLYGSVNARDIAEAVSAKSGLKIARGQVVLNDAFKSIGLFGVSVSLHPEVKVSISLNIARSEEEAAIQEKTGKALVAESAAAQAERDAEEAKKAFLEESALEAEAEEAEEAAKLAAEEAEEAEKKAAKKAKKAAKKPKDEESEASAEDAEEETEVSDEE
jgi:large subunit ribosomal protein L9